MSEKQEIKRDVVIIGGGPAGTTAATLLAEKGHKVLVLEKEKFPRYQIGESLMPYCYFPLQRLGVLDRMDSFQKKYAVQFVPTEGTASSPFHFSRHFDHEASMTWQVERSRFDKMLLDNAREKGAEVMEETQAVGLLREDGSVCGVAAKRVNGGEPLDVFAPITIDASGRQALAISRNSWRRWEPGLNKTAIWTYFKGATRDIGRDEGNTTIAYLPEKGWFWYIPMQDDVVSVGVVAEREYLFGETNDIREIFGREANKNHWVQERISKGQQFGKYHVTREYSYCSEYCAEDGLLLVGDAFLFLDPVFASGVYFALRGGELAADAVDRALEHHDVSAEQFNRYSERMLREVEPMRQLVYAFYDRMFNVRELMKQHPEVMGDWTDVLLGKLDKDFTQLFDAIREQATLPPPLDCGRPLRSAGRSVVH